MLEPSKKHQQFFDRIQSDPLKSPAFIGVLVLTVSVLLSGFYHRIQVDREHREANVLLRDFNARINDVFAYSELAAMTMAQGILSGKTVPDLEERASRVLAQNDYVDAVQMVPDGVITQVYPYEEYKSVLGYDIMVDQWLIKRPPWKQLRQEEYSLPDHWNYNSVALEWLEDYQFTAMEQFGDFLQL
jgi:hypothetical protein